MSNPALASAESPLCPHADVCGGCPLIALPYPEQLARKHARVARAFARFPLLAKVAVAPVSAAEPVTAYRTRAKLVAGAAGIGLYGRAHTLIDLPGCLVLPPDVAAVVARLRAYVHAGEVPVHDEGTGASGLRAVDLRGTAAGGAVLVTLILDDEPSARDAVRAMGERLARDETCVAGVFLAPHVGDSPRLLAPPRSRIAGGARVDDRVGETEYVAGPGAFVQAHRGQAARVHARVREHLVGAKASAPRVLDLYGGGGGIGLTLARAGARVTLVESFGPAVEDARESAARNGVTIETLASDAEQGLDTLLDRGLRFDAVVLNPPRRGCDAAVREKVARLRPEKIAYVSCDPETLARDLDHLRRLGYATLAAEPLDMIPLTEEVETVALLARAPSPHPSIVHEDDALLAVSKWPDEPVASHPKRVAATLARVRGRAAWASAVALFTPDEVTSGVCAFVRSASERAQWPAAESMHVTFTALVRGVVRDRGALRQFGPDAIHYRRLAVIAGQSLVEVSGEGAGSARVRREMAEIEHPVIGDPRHGHAPTNRHIAERYTLGRTFLHVAKLALVDPRTRARIEIASPLAPDLEQVLDRMRAGEAAARSASA